MTQLPLTSPVGDSVPKIDDSVAVGEDIAFQRRWWRFERAIWSVFVLILLADVFGLFGRGLLAKAERHTADRTLDLKYERIERASTPSIMTLSFGAAAIHNGAIKLYVSDTLVDKLGTQRVIPAPASSSIGDDGITYTFSATQIPAKVELALEPSFPGLHHIVLGVTGAEMVHASIFVVP